MPTRRVWRKHRSKDSGIQKKTWSTILMILTPLSETNSCIIADIEYYSARDIGTAADQRHSSVAGTQIEHSCALANAHQKRS